MEGTRGVGLVRVSAPVACLPRIGVTAPRSRAGLLHSTRSAPGRSVRGARGAACGAAGTGLASEGLSPARTRLRG